MLKELNAIAGGLLGLRGYPTQPVWSGVPRRDAPADHHPSIRVPKHGALARDGRPLGRHALHS
ncbi:hypothetical protein [Dokdonella fugitiva]|jgi:hypothetical protein|uniref:hypothetical protein n=1 Tax=Dokdonella fugitiva TaxID=328517 RepID=UPI0015FB6546|nr:hypothetical protein [Dokdonella fugitiva]MBA8883592.1 hypothetical protein [Dokdonella fugitiva]